MSTVTFADTAEHCMNCGVGVDEMGHWLRDRDSNRIRMCDHCEPDKIGRIVAGTAAPPDFWPASLEAAR